MNMNRQKHILISGGGTGGHLPRSGSRSIPDPLGSTSGNWLADSTSTLPNAINNNLSLVFIFGGSIKPSQREELTSS